jgi:hypothetical protein
MHMGIDKTRPILEFITGLFTLLVIVGIDDYTPPASYSFAEKSIMITPTP